MKTLKMWLTYIIASITLILVWNPVSTQGAVTVETPTSAPRATITPIPRSTVSATPIKQVTSEPPANDNSTKNENGAHIELHFDSIMMRYWTEIEWQDSGGGWHIVEGWRGYTNRGVTRWFVGVANFNKGPFRWVVYNQEAGQVMAFSNPFYLPRHPSQTLVTDVQIGK